MTLFISDHPFPRNRAKQNVRDFLDQFQQGSEKLLRYIGLQGDGRLASVIRNA